MPARAALPIASLLVAGLALAGCGGDERPAAGATTAPGAAATGAEDGRPAAPAGEGGPDATANAAPADEGRDGASGGPAAPTPPPASWTATCPTPTTSPLGCRAVRGRVLSIQSYDPDGDGDLHVVAVGGDVTLPGITVFDVRPALRPERDPVAGEYVTGAGPVFRGSLRQKQIQTDVFRVWRPGR